MTVNELQEMKVSGDDFFLLDVREPFELEICKIDFAYNIPMGQITNRLKEIPKNKRIVVMCHHGRRSETIANVLEQNGFTDIHNLEGGINDWAQTIDTSMNRY